ncbi:MAG: hypothetical protein KA155_03165 [Alphaproteobacteria bacterium]|jgi:hypothetical protein|nr:hypothetical protein [Alphaproteobacteria bacterium]
MKPLVKLSQKLSDEFHARGGVVHAHGHLLHGIGCERIDGGLGLGRLAGFGIDGLDVFWNADGRAVIEFQIFEGG